MTTRTYTRRESLKLLGAGLFSVSFIPLKKDSRHILTLSFDDGFKESSIKTAAIYEKYGLSACLNIIATAHLKTFVLPNEYHRWPTGNFELWNDLKAKGHEIMPHGLKHEDLTKCALQEAKDSVLRCLDIFTEELKGFKAKESIFNFPYNASTPELEEWMKTQVRAFRTGGNFINPLPYKGLQRLTSSAGGPGNVDQYLQAAVTQFLEGPPSWLLFNAHGLDDEGWGPISSSFLDELLCELTKNAKVRILPVCQALDTAFKEQKHI